MVFNGGNNLGTAHGRVVIDASGVRAGMQEAQNIFREGIRGIGANLQTLGDSMARVGTNITAMTAPLTIFGATGLRAAMDFDAAMVEISARTGLVGEDLDRIRDAAQEMGAATVFSSQQAADAFLELLSSGQSAEEALQTLPHVLNAAAAGGLGLGVAADTVTDILASFELEVNDAEYVVNSLAEATASSSANMSQMQQAFANVGGVANQFGMSVDETSAILAIFHERGIKGAEAGTQLRSMLMNMTRPTEAVQGAWDTLGVSVYDAEGNMRSMADIMADLRVVMDSGMFTQEEMNNLLKDIGGSYGMMGLTALTSGESIEEMTEKMNGQASAAEIAEQKNESFRARVNALMGSFQTMQVEVLTPFMNDTLKPLINTMIDGINAVTVWARENPELTKTIVEVSAALIALGPALIAAGTALSQIGRTVQLVGALLGIIASPIAIIAAAIAGLAYILVNDLGGVRTALSEFINDILDQFGGVEGILETVRAVAEDVLNDLATFGREAIQAIQPVLQDVGRWIGEAIGEVATFFQDSVLPALNTFVDWIVNTGLPLAIDFIQNSVWPLLQRFFTFLGNLWTIVAPGLAALGDWFLNDVVPQILSIVEESLYPLLQDVFGFLADAWDIVAPGLERLAAWFVSDALPFMMGFINQIALPAIQAFIDILRDIWNLASPFLLKLLDWIVNTGLPLAVTFIEDTVVPAIGTLVSALQDIWTKVQPVIDKLIIWFMETGWPIIEGIINDVIIPAVELLVGALKGIWEVVGPVIANLVAWFEETGWPLIQAVIDDVIMPAVQGVIDILSGIWDAVSGGLEAFKNGIQRIFSWVVENVIEPVFGRIEELVDTAKGAAEDVAQFLDDLNPTTGSGFLANNDFTDRVYSQVANNWSIADDTMKQNALASSGMTEAQFLAAYGSGSSQDLGGRGMAGELYYIGQRQQGREAFIPGDNGTFIPNLAQTFAGALAGAIGDGGGSGVTIQQLTIHANSETEGREAARGFADMLEDVRIRNGR